MNRRQKLAALCRIAEIQADRAKAPLAEAQRAVATAQDNLDKIARHRSQLTEQVSDPVLAAMLAGQSVRLQSTQARLTTTLAAKRAELDVAKAAARPAVGRHHALQKLYKNI